MGKEPISHLTFSGKRNTYHFYFWFSHASHAKASLWPMVLKLGSQRSFCLCN